MWQYFTKTGSASQDASDASEATSSSTSASSSFTFARLSSYVYDKAADVAFDLAPVEQSLSLLRISAVLVELSHLVYVTHTADVQQQTHVDLPWQLQQQKIGSLQAAALQVSNFWRLQWSHVHNSKSVKRHSNS